MVIDIKDMTPKQFIRYTQMLDKKGLAICDGISESIPEFPLYLWFLLTGIPIFMILLIYYDKIKEKILRR